MTPKKTEANLSTERNTPRDLKFSEDVRPSYEPSIIIREVEHLEFTPVDSIICKDSNRKSVGLKVTKSQKTLEKLY